MGRDAIRNGVSKQWRDWCWTRWVSRSIIEHMFPPAQVRDEMAAWVAALDPSALTSADAVAHLSVVIEIEKLAAAAKTLLFPRAADSGEWTRRGFRSAEHWLAALSGETLTDATRTA